LECAALGARLGRTARPDAGGGVGLAAAGRGFECPACSRICCWCQARDEWECNPLPAADKFGTPRYENGSTARSVPARMAASALWTGPPLWPEGACPGGGGGVCRGACLPACLPLGRLALGDAVPSLWQPRGGGQRF
jgi:hypothetical protein